MNEYERLACKASRSDEWFTARDALTSEYAWAIPNVLALATLARYAPLVEIGAGTGYWAYLLRQRGVDIIAYDSAPPHSHPNPFHKARSENWTSVLEAGARVAGDHADRTLFICWPPFDEPMASDALTAYAAAGGERLVFVGEARSGCTGDEAFHDALEANWIKVEAVCIPRWRGIWDELTVYRRLTLGQ